MNTPQRTVVILAALICTALTLYPPFEFKVGSYFPAQANAEAAGEPPLGLSISLGGQMAVARGWLFQPPMSKPDPRNPGVKGFGHRVLLDRLAVEWALVIFPAAALWALLSPRAQRPRAVVPLPAAYAEPGH